MRSDRDIRQANRQSQSERVQDWGWLLGLFGLASAAFVIGRSSAPDHDCCERLVNRDSELILCEQRLNNLGQ